MNIAIFTDCYVPVKNGVVTSISQLRAGLEAKGHRVIIFTVEARQHIESDPEIIRFPSFPIGLGTELAFGWVKQSDVNRIIQLNNIELIHTHTEFSLAVSSIFAARRFCIPRVQTVHTMWEDYRHYIMHGLLFRPILIRTLFKWLLKGCSAIVAPSQKARNYYQSIVPDTAIDVIPNGLDSSVFKHTTLSMAEIEQVRLQWKLGSSDKVVLFVGRIGKEKRVSELFDALLPVLRADPLNKMVFVGDGPLFKKLKARAVNLGLAEQFIFTGFVDWNSMHELYSQADLFVTASTSEVHSMTLIEAMMCSLPVVARRDDSFLDSIVHEKNGYLADTDSELTEYVRQLLSDQLKRESFARESLKSSQNFTAKAHSDQMEKLYNRVLLSGS